MTDVSYDILHMYISRVSTIFTHSDLCNALVELLLCNVRSLRVQVCQLGNMNLSVLVKSPLYTYRYIERGMLPPDKTAVLGTSYYHRKVHLDQGNKTTSIFVTTTD